MIATGNTANAQTMGLAQTIQGRSLWVDARRRLFRNRAAMAGIIILALIAALEIC